MISIILGEGQSSRLNQNLIEKNNEHIFISAEAGAYSFKDGGNFLVQASFYPDKKEDVIKLMEEELKKLLEMN